MALCGVAVMQRSDNSSSGVHTIAPAPALHAIAPSLTAPPLESSAFTIMYRRGLWNSLGMSEFRFGAQIASPSPVTQRDRTRGGAQTAPPAARAVPRRLLLLCNCHTYTYASSVF